MNAGGIYDPKDISFRIEKLLFVLDEEFEDKLFLRVLLNSIDPNAKEIILDGPTLSRLLSLERKYLG